MNEQVEVKAAFDKLKEEQEKVVASAEFQVNACKWNIGIVIAAGLIDGINYFSLQASGISSPEDSLLVKVPAAVGAFACGTLIYRILKGKHLVSKAIENQHQLWTLGFNSLISNPET